MSNDWSDYDSLEVGDIIRVEGSAVHLKLIHKRFTPGGGHGMGEYPAECILIFNEYNEYLDEGVVYVMNYSKWASRDTYMDFTYIGHSKADIVTNAFRK